MSVDEAENIPYEDFYYIKLIPGEKNPIESWGGYGNDPTEAVESNDPEINVYTHEDVVESDHEAWGIVGIKGSGRSLLVYDLDIYKADDFDPDEITIDGTEGVPVVKSPSGGLHVYTAVYEERASGSESDFSVADELPFDIDIRGSFVSMHPVAPNAIPGVGGDYELTNDVSLMTHSGVRDSVSKLKFAESGEPIIEYDVDTGVSDFTFERSGEVPDEMPKCYHSALQLREADPDDHPSIFKVDSFAAMCGVAAGYSKEEMMQHFLEDFSPGMKADRQKTRDHLDHIFGKMGDGDLAPPAVSTLREWGILADDETCNCSIDYHGGAGSTMLAGSEGAETADGHELPAPGPEHGFSVRNGRYGVKEIEYNDDGEPITRWDDWTNFQLELNAVLTAPEGDRMMNLTVHPVDEPAYNVEVEPTALNEVRTFKEEVCIGVTTTFDGSNSDLTKIKQFVGSQDAPRKTGTRHMGYHRDEGRGVWVTPNGNLGPDGWIEDTDIAFVERGIEAERKWRLSPEDGDEYDRQAVVEMLELLPGTRDTERLLPLLSWSYAAATRPLIMDWSGQFNFVSVTGGTGAGKTTTISTLWKLMGMESDPMSADTTTATLLTTLASTNSIPMWFDEYKPSDMRNDKVNEFHNKLRKTTRGGVGQRSNADLSNEGYPLHAPVIVSGEERIQGSAEERRGIFTSFRKSTTDPDTETARAFAKLSGTAAEDEEDSTRSTYYEGYDYDDQTLAWVRWVTDQDVDELEAMWRAADEYVRDLLSELGIAVPGDLALQGLQTIRYGCMLYRQFYNDIGGEGDVITDEEIDDAINFVVAGSVGGTNQRDHLDVLLDVASRAARAGYLEEDDSYTFVHKGKPNEELRINLATSFDLVKRYAHDHEISEDLLNNKHDYDSRLKDDGENIEWLTARGQNSDPIGRAIGIDTDLAEDIVDGFGRWMWDEDVEGSQPDTWQTLAEAPRGRVNITVEVTDASTDTPDGIAESGVLTDSTNSMDYVVFESDREHIPRLEEGECYAFRGAKLGNHDEAPQIVLDGGVRDCEEVEPGYGHIARPDAGMDTALDAAVADGGGAVQLTESVENAVEENAPAEAGVIAGLVVGRGAADDIEEVKKAISRLESAGRITDFGDGYEPSSGRSGAGQ